MNCLVHMSFKIKKANPYLNKGIMISKGIRLKNENGNFVTITIKDVLEQVVDGENLKWSILYLDGEGSPKTILYIDLVKEINNRNDGYVLRWNELKSFVSDIYSIDWIKIIGCKNLENLRKYQIDRELYETADVCIELFDSSYWEIFTKDPIFYDNLVKRFPIQKFLDTDFLEKQ